MRATDLVPATVSDQPRPCRLVEWKPRQSGSSSLIGYATVSFSGWIVSRIPIWRGDDGSLSPGMPSAPEVEGDGRVKLGPDGKRIYWRAVSFEGREARERWERSILVALREAGIGGAP